MAKIAMAGDAAGPMPADDKNLLAYGDNLDVLRRYVRDESVDLVYLDPPFNSNADYNVLYAQQDGTRAAAQIKAFKDTWRWDQAAVAAYKEVVEAGGPASQALQAFRMLLGPSNLLAYLAMMAPRLVELRRVLKPSGSLYLHCDPTASHHLKLLLDAVFGAKSFRNEIVWAYRKWSVEAGQFARNHDTILFYSKDADGSQTFNPLHVPVSAGTMRRWKGKRQQAYFEDGVRKATSRQSDDARSPMPDWWEISILNPNAAERLGYPTQKPLALLERIIAASTNPGDLVLDPFAGCGTALDAAHAAGRRWIGIDVTHHAIALIKHRLVKAHGPEVIEGCRVIGEPTTLEDAKVLAGDDPFQFQAWALGLVGARPINGVKHGADRGIDGQLFFHESEGGVTRQILISVKAGHTGPSHVRDLRGVIEREAAEIGVLISLAEPTGAMRSEAAEAGFYEFKGRNYPRVQLKTVGELLDGKGIEYPSTAETVFRPTIWPPESIPVVPRARRRRRASQPAGQTPVWPAPALAPGPVGESPVARRLREDYERRAAELAEPTSQEVPQSPERSKRDR